MGLEKYVEAVVRHEPENNPDLFSARLRRALERAATREAPLESPAAPADGRDEFSDRLSRALERAQGRSPACQVDAAESQPPAAQPHELDPELRTVVESWPQLPGFVKSFIVTMVKANKDKPVAA